LYDIWIDINLNVVIIHANLGNSKRLQNEVQLCSYHLNNKTDGTISKLINFHLLHDSQTEQQWCLWRTRIWCY